MRCFGDAKDTIDSKQLNNQIYLLRFGHTSALLLKKKVTRKGHFPRPGETDPYAGTEPQKSEALKIGCTTNRMYKNRIYH